MIRYIPTPLDNRYYRVHWVDGINLTSKERGEYFVLITLVPYDEGIELSTIQVYHGTEQNGFRYDLLDFVSKCKVKIPLKKLHLIEIGSIYYNGNYVVDIFPCTDTYRKIRVSYKNSQNVSARKYSIERMLDEGVKLDDIYDKKKLEDNIKFVLPKEQYFVSKIKFAWLMKLATEDVTFFFFPFDLTRFFYTKNEDLINLVFTDKYFEPSSDFGLSCICQSDPMNEELTSIKKIGKSYLKKTKAIYQAYQKVLDGMEHDLREISAIPPKCYFPKTGLFDMKVNGIPYTSPFGNRFFLVTKIIEFEKAK